MAKLARDRGLVLCTQDVAETDRIVTILTEKRGKLRILVKRARRIDSHAGAILDVLNYAEVIFYERRELPLLREASLLHIFRELKEDLQRLEAAMRAAAIVARLLPDRQSYPEVLALLLDYLRALEGGLPPTVGELSFELKLLGRLGLGPFLDGCIECGGRKGLTWSPERGGLLCTACGGKGEEVSPQIWKALRGLRNLPLSAGSRVRLPEGVLTKAQELVERFIAWHLGR